MQDIIHPIIGAAEQLGKKKQVSGAPETAFGCPRDFLDNRFVHSVVFARAPGPVDRNNMNPGQRNFDCVYFSSLNSSVLREARLAVDVMRVGAEEDTVLCFIASGRIHDRLWFRLRRDEFAAAPCHAQRRRRTDLRPNFCQERPSVHRPRPGADFPFSSSCSSPTPSA
ncbi:MAG: hypothetical protein U1F65_04185 [Verrucomicrobiota bacterium]